MPVFSGSLSSSSDTRQFQIGGRAVALWMFTNMSGTSLKATSGGVNGVALRRPWSCPRPRGVEEERSRRAPPPPPSSRTSARHRDHQDLLVAEKFLQAFLGAPSPSPSASAFSPRPRLPALSPCLSSPCAASAALFAAHGRQTWLRSGSNRPARAFGPASFAAAPAARRGKSMKMRALRWHGGCNLLCMRTRRICRAHG